MLPPTKYLGSHSSGPKHRDVRVAWTAKQGRRDPRQAQDNAPTPEDPVNGEIERLEYYVTQAHKNGRKVRLWGSPENKVVWGELLKCNVDLINTNKLNALRKFLTADVLSVAKKG